MSVPTRTVTALKSIKRLSAFFTVNDADPNPVFFVADTDQPPQAVGINLDALLDTSGKISTAAGKLRTIGTLNATGVLTATLLTGGVVTSTTAAAVTGTTDTAANIVAAIPNAAVGMVLECTIANTGGANAFTTAAGANVTLLGTAAIAAGKTARLLLVLTNVGAGTETVTAIQTVSA